MFRPLSLWSKLPCPAIQTGRPCTVPHCLFSHENVASPTVTSATPTPIVKNAEDPRVRSTPTPPQIKTGDVKGKAAVRLANQNEGNTATTPIATTTTTTTAATDPRLRNIVRANALGLAKEATTGDDERGNKRRKLSEDYVETSSRDSRSSSDSSGGGVLLFEDGEGGGGKVVQKDSPKKAISKREVAGSSVRGILKKASKDSNMGNSTVSAPATKRSYATAASTGASMAVSASTAIAQTPSTTPKATIVPSAVKKPDIPPLKPEKPLTLNPRLISRSPAGHDVRLRLLTLLHGEYTRLKNPTSEVQKQEIIRRALDEEEHVAKELRNIYDQAMKKRIFKLQKTSPAEFAAAEAEDARKKAAEEESVKRNSNKEGLVVKDDLDNDRPALATGVSPKEELQILRELVHTKEVLVKYGYILSPPSEEEVEMARKGVEAGRGWEGCDRCGSRFQVFKGRRESDGKLAGGGKCVYHWGRGSWGERASYGPSTNEKTFSCCGQTVGASPGCTTAETHVYKVSELKRLAATWQYVQTSGLPLSLTPSSDEEGQLAPPIERAICLDCEMCYTTLGMELIRISATAFPGGEVVLDALVMPKGEVLDLNTRFSGVVSSQLADSISYCPGPYPTTPDSADQIINPTISATSSTTSTKLPLLPSPTAARDALLSLITPSTPLIGHALENDLNALRLCHETVIDTAILFPHKRGLPARNKLKWLVEKHLLRRIQVEGVVEVRGHDSLVDARCAGELVRLRVKEVVEKKQRMGVAGVKRHAKRKETPGGGSEAVL